MDREVEGFRQMIALYFLADNVHIVGQIVRDREMDHLKDGRFLPAELAADIDLDSPESKS